VNSVTLKQTTPLIFVKAIIFILLYIDMYALKLTLQIYSEQNSVIVNVTIM